MSPTFTAARRVLERAAGDGVFPAAVAEVGTPLHSLWRQPFGRLSLDPSAPSTQEDTVFDLASLTKVLATTPLLMQMVERGFIHLDDPVSAHIPGWRDHADAVVAIRDLLAHCSGLPAYAPLYRDHSSRAGFEEAICAVRREYPPRSTSVYSDLGFMLLGFILENTAPLPVQFESLMKREGLGDLQFQPPASWRSRTAPARHDEWRGRLLVEEVDDNNAWALGGAAGHAGLFGTAASVGGCARHLLQALAGHGGAFQRETVLTFVTRRSDVPDSSRALGWDTMLPTSSCGTALSRRAFGHTGYTGTSLWVDPEREVYVVLLTNRVHPAATNDAIKAVRPAFHDAVMAELP